MLWRPCSRHQRLRRQAAPAQPCRNIFRLPRRPASTGERKELLPGDSMQGRLSPVLLGVFRSGRAGLAPPDRTCRSRPARPAPPRESSVPPPWGTRLPPLLLSWGVLTHSRPLPLLFLMGAVQERLEQGALWVGHSSPAPLGALGVAERRRIDQVGHEGEGRTGREVPSFRVPRLYRQGEGTLYIFHVLGGRYYFCAPASWEEARNCHCPLLSMQGVLQQGPGQGLLWLGHSRPSLLGVIGIPRTGAVLCRHVGRDSLAILILRED